MYSTYKHLMLLVLNPASLLPALTEWCNVCKWRQSWWIWNKCSESVCGLLFFNCHTHCTCMLCPSLLGFLPGFLATGLQTNDFIGLYLSKFCHCCTYKCHDIIKYVIYPGISIVYCCLIVSGSWVRVVQFWSLLWESGTGQRKLFNKSPSSSSSVRTYARLLNGL